MKNDMTEEKQKLETDNRNNEKVQNLMMMMMMMMMMMNCFCGTVDRRKAFRLVSSRDHCQRSSPSQISDTLRVGFEPAQNLSLGLAEWNCAVVITTAPREKEKFGIESETWEESKTKLEVFLQEKLGLETEKITIDSAIGSGRNKRKKDEPS